MVLSRITECLDDRAVAHSELRGSETTTRSGCSLSCPGVLRYDLIQGDTRMNFNTALHFVNLFFVGILAGMEIVIHYGLRAPSEVLSERSQLQLRQALVLRLRILVPTFFVPSAFSGIAVAALDGSAVGLWLRCVGLLAMLVWILVRIVGTVPINSATISWKLAEPPTDWRAQVARAERFHDIGVWAVVLSFACFLTSTALTLSVRAADR